MPGSGAIFEGALKIMESTSHVFDVGNTRIKAGRFHGSELAEVYYVDSVAEMRTFLETTTSPAIISSVGTPLHQLAPADRPNLVCLGQDTPLPIRIDYQTQETLGKDRVAGAVGAQSEFPGEPCLIVDTGTCVNYDLLDAHGTFQGGAISPGFSMRMHAMHKGTQGLPDITAQFDAITSRFPGKSTTECLRQGVELGLQYEVQGVIDKLRATHDGLRVILSGGDWKRFESFIKGPIFARPEIVLIGLNRILAYNEVV